MSYLTLGKQIDFLRELVDIDSPSSNISGVNAVQDWIATKLKGFGFDIEFEDNFRGVNGAKLLIAERLGEKSGKSYINFITHADTVYRSDSAPARFHLDLKRMIGTGSGVIDDKGGIVVALAGLEKFIEQREADLNLRFICSPSEEIGSPGFQSLFSKLSADSKMVLAFEPSMDDGSIIESRRGNRWYQVTVEGQEGHAGRDHKKGVNAIVELAHKVTRIQNVTDYGNDLTLSLGEIAGGKGFNVICGHAHAKIDVRFSDLEARNHAHGEIEKIVSTSYVEPNRDGLLPRSSYEIIDDCPPLARSRESCQFLQKYLDILEEVERRPVQAVPSGGTADCNYMVREGLPILDGLGATGGGMHTSGEFVRLMSLETRGEALNRFLQLVSLHDDVTAPVI